MVGLYLYKFFLYAYRFDSFHANDCIACVQRKVALNLTILRGRGGELDFGPDRFSAQMRLNKFAAYFWAFACQTRLKTLTVEASEQLLLVCACLCVSVCVSVCALAK